MNKDETHCRLGVHTGFWSTVVYPGSQVICPATYVQRMPLVGVCLTRQRHLERRLQSNNVTSALLHQITYELNISQ